MATTPKDFFKSASGHLRAVEVLFPHEFKKDGTRDPIFFAIYNILGFAVELYLKAFLTKSGLQESELRNKKYGHNLANLFEEAKLRGFTVCLNEMDAIVKILGEGHGEFGYRYVQNEGVLNHFNNLSLVIQVLKKVHVSMQEDLV